MTAKVQHSMEALQIKWKHQKVEWVRDRKYYLQIKISDVERKLKNPDVPKTDWWKCQKENKQ